MFFTASIFFYKLLLNRFTNYSVALVGTLFFVLSPRIYGNSFFNMKDIISLSLLTIALYYCFKLFDKTNYKNFLIFSIFAALSTSQRMYGIFLPLSFIIFYLIHTKIIQRTITNGHPLNLKVSDIISKRGCWETEEN